MVDSWHYSHDMNIRLLGLVEQVEEIERLLYESLAELPVGEH